MELVYKKYKTLKSTFNFNHREYELKYIMAHDFLFYSYPNSIIFNKHEAKELITKIDDLNVYTNYLALSTDLYSTLDYGVDHSNLLHEVMAYSPNSQLIEHSYSKKKKINLYNIITSVIQCVIFWKPKNISFREKIYYTCKCIYYKNFIDELEAQASVVNTIKYISYLSATTPDSILCQFFKMHNIPTYCIQHGVFRAVEDYKSFIPLDVVNLENFQADYMLSWGEFTKNELIKSGYPESSFLLAGHPRYSNVKIDINPTMLGTKKCIVSLARDAYEKENLELLKIAVELQKNGTEVILKFHPRSDLKKYEKCLNSNNLDYMDVKTTLSKSIRNYNPNFVIVYNSTVYYEYYLNNVPVFRFGLNEFDIPLGLDEDRFTSYTELIQKIGIIKNMNQDVYLQKLKNTIGKVIAYGVNNYKQILSND